MDYEKTRVFLADDHEMVREGLAALVERTGRFQVVGQCGDGLHVVEAVIESGPDLVVLDVQMPGLNGVDVCRELSARVPETAVLILSMHDNEEFIIRSLENGAKGYLLKESAGTELARALETISSGETYLGPGIPESVLDQIGQNRPDAYDRLTTREREVLQLIAEGNTNREVADLLELSVKTIDTHRMRLMRKLDIHDQTTLVKFAISRGIVPEA